MDYFFHPANSLGPQGFYGPAPIVYSYGMRAYYPSPFHPLSSTSVSERSSSANLLPWENIQNSSKQGDEERTDTRDKNNVRQSKTPENSKSRGTCPSRVTNDKNGESLSDEDGEGKKCLKYKMDTIQQYFIFRS